MKSLVCVCLLLSCAATTVRANFVFEFEIHRHITNGICAGHGIVCKTFVNFFCLRPPSFIGTRNTNNNDCPLGPRNDNRVFTDAPQTRTIISSSHPWPGSFQLHIQAFDDDEPLVTYDFLDDIFVEGSVSVGSDFSAKQRVWGVNFKVAVDIRYRALCQANFSEGFENPETNCVDIVCGAPHSPVNGQVSSTSPASSPGTVVQFQCDGERLPHGVMNSTCTIIGGVGVWMPDTGITCRSLPVTCTLPPEPANGTIVDFVSFNETVEVGTTLIYQCDSRLSLTGPSTIVCTNDGEWSAAPNGTICVVMITPQTSPIGPIVGGVVGGILFLVALIVIIIIVLLVLSTKRTKYTIPTGPVYDQEASPGPIQQIELKTNSAYGPVTGVPSAPREEIELKTNSAYGPVTDVPSAPREEIELKTNSAYGPVTGVPSAPREEIELKTNSAYGPVTGVPSAPREEIELKTNSAYGPATDVPTAPRQEIELKTNSAYDPVTRSSTAGPVYDYVLSAPKEEKIEMKANYAYGQRQ